MATRVDGAREASPGAGGCLLVRSEHVCVPRVLFGNDLLELQNLVSLYISALTFAVFLEQSCEGRTEEGERETYRERGRFLLLPLLLRSAPASDAVSSAARLLLHPIDTVLCMLVLYFYTVA